MCLENQHKGFYTDSPYITREADSREKVYLFSKCKTAPQEPRVKEDLEKSALG